MGGEAVARSRDRYRRVGLSWLSNVGARALQFTVSLAVVPLALGHLGAAGYGVWMTISSLVAILAFADLGIGAGLVTRLSTSLGLRDRRTATSQVSSAFLALVVLAVGLGALFFAAFPLVDWAAVFRAPGGRLAQQVPVALAAAAGLFLASLPLDVVQRVRLSLQEGYVNGVWAGVASLVSLGAVYLMVRLEAPMPWFVVAVAGAPVLAGIGNGLSLVLGGRTWLLPRLSTVDRGTLRSVMGLSGYFFIVQVASALAYQSDSLILTRIIGPSAVTAYAVPLRLFLVVPTALYLALGPLWPAYSEARARGDHEWSRGALKRSLALTGGVAVPGAAVMVAAGPWLLRLWIGGAISPDRGLLLAMGIWIVTSSLGTVFTVFLNAAGVVKPQAALSLVMVCVNVPLSVILTRSLGVQGVMWGTVLSHGALILLPFAGLALREILRTQTPASSL